MKESAFAAKGVPRNTARLRTENTAKGSASFVSCHMSHIWLMKAKHLGLYIFAMLY